MSGKTSVEVYTESAWVVHQPLRNEYSDKFVPGRFRTTGTVSISWNGKRVTAFAKAESDIIDTNVGKSARMALVLNAAAAEAIGHSAFSIFSENELLLGSPSEINAEQHTKIVVPVAAHFFKRLEEQQVQQQLGIESLDYARKRLYDYAASPPPPGYANDSEEMYRFIQESLAAGNVGSERPWCNEKLGRIRRALDELETRKNRRHDGYKRAQDEITGILINFPVPRSWWSEPPILQMKK